METWLVKEVTRDKCKIWVLPHLNCLKMLFQNRKRFHPWPASFQDMWTQQSHSDAEHHKWAEIAQNGLSSTNSESVYQHEIQHFHPIQHQQKSWRLFWEHSKPWQHLLVENFVQLVLTVNGIIPLIKFFGLDQLANIGKLLGLAKCGQSARHSFTSAEGIGGCDVMA